MNQAIGLIEIQGYGTAVMIADTMLKVAAVELIGVQRAKGFGWMTVEVSGDVGAVKAAVDAGKAKAVEANSLISALVIPRPANSLDKVILEKVDYPKDSKEDIQPPVTEESEKVEEKVTEAIEKAVEEAAEKVTPEEPMVEKEAVEASKSPEDSTVVATTETEQDDWAKKSTTKKKKSPKKKS